LERAAPGDFAPLGSIAARTMRGGRWSSHPRPRPKVRVHEGFLDRGSIAAANDYSTMILPITAEEEMAAEQASPPKKPGPRKRCRLPRKMTARGRGS